MHIWIRFFCEYSYYFWAGVLREESVQLILFGEGHQHTHTYVFICYDGYSFAEEFGLELAGYVL